MALVHGFHRRLPTRGRGASPPDEFCSWVHAAISFVMVLPGGDAASIVNDGSSS